MGSTGDWGEPEPGIVERVRSYLGSLPVRAQMKFAQEGLRLKQLGETGLKEQIRDMRGPGGFVDAYDAGREGNYGQAAGHAAMGALDMAGGAASKGPRMGLEALKAWGAATKARPTDVAEMAAAELKKLLPKSGKFNAESKAHLARVEKANLAAERGVATPKLPPGAWTPRMAEEMLASASKTPFGGFAGIGAAATGVPGVMVDDVKEQFHPLHDMNQEVAAEDKSSPRAPFAPDTGPEVAHYQKQIDESKRGRNLNSALAAAESVGGAGATYGAMKSVPWAFRNSIPSVGMALGEIHPALSLLGFAPLAIPAALGYGSWKAANAIPDNINYALKHHDDVKLKRKIQDNYRDPDMKLTADGDY